MSFQRFMNKFCCFLVLLTLFSGTWVIRAAQVAQVQLQAAPTIAEKYRLVRDNRNFKESRGGKGVPAQGRVLETLTTSMVINERLIQPDASLARSGHPWRYVVSVSCMRGTQNPKDIVQQFVANLLPQQELNRLAIIININEKIVGFSEEKRKKTFDIKGIVSDKEQKEIAAYGVPVLLLYTPWTSFREDINDTDLSPEQVRRNIFQELDALKENDERQYDGALEKLNVDDATHKFPFGQMRTHMINCQASKDFIKKLKSDNVGLYLHIQDSDYKDLKTQPLFYNFGQPTVITNNEKFLFKRYDALIAHQILERVCMPVLIGGAYVYAPDEDLDGTSLESRYWSRFAIEMTNIVKHLTGMYAPFGLYFHEPNTCLLLYAPKNYAIAGGEKLKGLLESGAIKFGIDSEVQDLSRKLFKGCTLAEQRDAMVFDAQAILATSMKSAKRNFVIKYRGKVYVATKKFTMQSARKQDCTADSLQHIHGAKQGGLKPQDIRSCIATGFKAFLSVNAKSKITTLLKLCDPYWMTDTCDLNDLANILINYDQLLQANQQGIRKIWGELQGHYNKKNNGKEIAYMIVAIIWECGQAKRLMLLDHLVLPQGGQVPAQVADIRKFLGLRLDHTHHSSGFPTQSYFVGDILGLNSPAKEIQHNVAWQLVEYMRNDAQSKTRMCKMLQISLPTLNKLIGKKQTPRAIEGIFKHFYDMFKQQKLHTDFGLQASDSEVIVEKVCFS